MSLFMTKNTDDYSADTTTSGRISIGESATGIIDKPQPKEIHVHCFTNIYFFEIRSKTKHIRSSEP